MDESAAGPVQHLVKEVPQRRVPERGQRGLAGRLVAVLKCRPGGHQRVALLIAERLEQVVEQAAHRSGRGDGSSRHSSRSAGRSWSGQVATRGPRQTRCASSSKSSHRLACRRRRAPVPRRFSTSAPYKQVLAGRERTFGPDHPETLAARADLAAACDAAGQMGAALQLRQEVCAGYERVFGDAHPATLACRADLARAYAAVGQAGEAMALLREAIARSEQALSSGDPLTLALRQVLAEITGEMTAW